MTCVPVCVCRHWHHLNTVTRSRLEAHTVINTHGKQYTTRDTRRDTEQDDDTDECVHVSHFLIVYARATRDIPPKHDASICWLCVFSASAVRSMHDERVYRLQRVTACHLQSSDTGHMCDERRQRGHYAQWTLGGTRMREKKRASANREQHAVHKHTCKMRFGSLGSPRRGMDCACQR